MTTITKNIISKITLLFCSLFLFGSVQAQNLNCDLFSVESVNLSSFKNIHSINFTLQSPQFGGQATAFIQVQGIGINDPNVELNFPENGGNVSFSIIGIPDDLETVGSMLAGEMSLLFFDGELSCNIAFEIDLSPQQEEFETEIPFYPVPTPSFEVSTHRVGDTETENESSIINVDDVWGIKKAWPQPAKNELYVEFETKDKDNNNNDETEVVIYDLIGNIVANERVTQTNIVTLDVSSLPKGNYLLQLKNAERLDNKRIIIY